jgi:zinc/manganese transport system substrate-binding protein
MIIETIIIKSESAGHPGWRLRETQGAWVSVRGQVRAADRRLLARVGPAGILVLAVIAALALTAAAAYSSGKAVAAAGGKIVAVGAENQYADVISQVGGKYVATSAIMSNPNTDPHSFEASIAVAREVGSAQLVVQNGLGYDSFMDSIESATAGRGRQVINVQQLLRLPDSTANPHLWYAPATMPKLAAKVAADLSAIQPSHAAYFRANAADFTASLKQLTAALASFKSAFPGTAVATTEPVADYLLDALGARNLTPWTFQADIMNGVDPSPQNTATERALLTRRKVSVFVYNQQVTDSLTESFITLAEQNHIPVVGVYETMPTPGYDFQTWMLREVQALRNAVTGNVSTEHL